MPGTALTVAALGPGLVLCWPQQHSANAARPARISSACTKALKTIPRDQRRSRDQTARLIAQLGAITAAAEVGLKAHDRWLNQRMLLLRKLSGRRSTSKLPTLIDYVLSRPVVSAGMIAEELGISARAAQDLVAELGLREATGRGRHRAWGIR